MIASRKIRKIYERTGILLTHSEISFLCRELGYTNPEDTWNAINTMSKEELAKLIIKIRKKALGLWQEQTVAPYLYT